MAGIPWPILSSDLPPTFEAPVTPHSFLDCCRPHSTATPSPQYIVIAANFFTHASNKARFKVNININTVVPTVYWRGLFWTAGLPPSLSTSSSFFLSSSYPCCPSATSPPSMAARNVPWDCLLWFCRCISPATINWPGARTHETIVNMLNSDCQSSNE